MEEIKKGWSRDRKYRVRMAAGGDYLLRLREGGGSEAQAAEGAFILSLFELGLPVPRLLETEEWPQGAGSYLLLDWMEGVDLSEVLPQLPVHTQYALGLEAGRILLGIHQAPPPPGAPAPRDQRQRALEKVEKFEEAGIKLPGTERVAAFARGHLHWLEEHPGVCQHGDFHPGNLVYTGDGRLAVIDFNRWDIGDVAEEFVKLQSFTIESSLPFAIGQLDGYFTEQPPKAFWQALAVHAAVTALYSIRWARPFGEEEVAAMAARCRRAIRHYKGFTEIIPSWYKGRKPPA